MSEALLFGRKVKQCRAALDLTQEALAEKIGCAVEHVRKIEAGKRRPSRELAQRLAEVLQIAPTARSEFVQAARIASEQAARERAPYLRPPAANQHNLPLQLTSFVGRQAELHEVLQLLATTRLLTVTGIGGGGKTRLAMHVAMQLVPTYTDGVWLVELAALTEATLVPKAVAQVLGVREELGREIVVTLIDHLREKDVLLVLDNCEHLVDMCAHLAERLLVACPQLKILATSREPLRVAGEVLWRVPPLSFPARELLLSVDALNTFEAVQLFVARAQSHDPHFELRANNAAAIVEICRRLDGIPLAIELAAARVRLLTVEQVAGKLDDALRLLTGGSRTALPRHQTLRAAVEWSYTLLSFPAQKLFRRLASFAGGWSLEAAEAISAIDGIEVDVLDLLSQLVDQSLVVTDAEHNQILRYRMLEPVRQYAWEQLTASGELQPALHRHAEFFVALVEQAEPQLQGPEQKVWIDQLEHDLLNIRAALQTSIEQRDVELAERLGSALYWFWATRGYITEGRRWLEQIIALEPHAPGLGEVQKRARLITRGKLLHALGGLAMDQNDYDQARAYCERSLTLCRETGDNSGVAKNLKYLGAIAYQQGDLQRSMQLMEAALPIFRTLGDEGQVSRILNNLGVLAAARGELEVAERYYNESLALERELGNIEGIAHQLGNLGGCAFDRGDNNNARTYFEESLALRREIGYRFGIARSLINLAWVMVRQKDYPAAVYHARESLELRRDLGDRRGIAECLEVLAQLALVAHVDGAQRAARLLGAAEELRATIGAKIDPSLQTELVQTMDAARAQLGEPRFTAAQAVGRTLPLEQAIAYGLQL